MSKVYAIQVPARREGSRWVEKFDLSAAERFGEVVRCLPFGNVPEDPEPTRRRLTLALADYDPASDYVLLLGDPVAIAQAVNVLTVKLLYTGLSKIRVLKWDKRAGEYAVYSVG